MQDKKGWSEHLPDTGLESPKPLAVTSKVQVTLLIELFHLILHTTCLDKHQFETAWWFHFSHFSSLTPEPQTGQELWDGTHQPLWHHGQRESADNPDSKQQRCGMSHLSN